MFDFAWPWLALLWPLPWLLRWWSGRATPAARRAVPDGVVLLNPAVSRLKAAFASRGAVERRWQWLGEVLGALLWSALVLAVMGPRWMERYTDVVSHGHDLMMAVDVSRSMEALDFELDNRPVNRLAVVKGVVGQFIERRLADRIGLILFGDAAYLQSPLTLDGAAVRAMLEAVVPRLAGDGTAIGDAVGLAVKKLRTRPAGGRVIILLTDGENTAGGMPPLEAARLANHYGIRLYTIGVGSQGKVPVPEGDELVMKAMPLDETLLKAMADVTGGRYFRATDRRALQGVYEHIDGLVKTEVVTRSILVPQPLFRWPLGVAVALLLTMGAVALAGRRGFSGR